MKLFRYSAILLLSTMVAAFTVGCNGVNGSSKEKIDQQIHDYLINHPEILIEMSNKLQEKMRQEQTQKATQSIKDNAAALLNNPASPVTGNKAGTVTLVEFFDYQCVHCAEMYPVVKKLMAANPNVRVVSKEFPIFGAVSEYAAAAALAAGKQGKFAAMHNALYESGKIEGKMTPAIVDKIAVKVGLNVAKMKQDMKSAEVQKELKDTRDLAIKLGIQGTPAFIIAPTDATKASDDNINFIPGGTSGDNLQQAVNKAK